VNSSGDHMVQLRKASVKRNLETKTPFPCGAENEVRMELR
jgi:hypothetical protein